MAIADYLQKLVELKKQLAANLRSMGVAAEDSEKLNTLVPKVLECKTEQNVEWVDNPSGGLASLNSIVKKVDVPYGISSIVSGAFQNCTSLASINIPDSVTSIGRMAFINCKSLESITIGNGVKSIGSQAIQGCAIKSITIPNSVTSIGSMAFINCSSLANIYYKGTEEQWNAITKGTNWNQNMGSNVEGGTVIHYNYVP